MKILSPLTKTDDISFVQSLDIARLVDQYKKILNLDVSSYFKGIDQISVYIDNQTGYKFYHPFDISGDASFYEFLQQFEFYYNAWKWEHETAYMYIKENTDLLEVGCAKGDFLQKIRTEKKVNVKGLELNPKAIEAARNMGLDVQSIMVEEYAKKNIQQLDVVCSFQVLEHVVEVQEFLQAKIDCLKVGGRLIICVPNNNSFLKDEYNILNMPPHHVGLWNSKSLESLTKIYPLKMIATHYEPLQEPHLKRFKLLVLGNLKRFGIPIRISKCFWPLILKCFTKTYKSFNILCVYEKK